MLLRALLLICLTLNPLAVNLKAADIFDLGERYFQTVGNEESIPLGIITALTQDHSGFLWIGTQKGVLRYDGYRFKHYQHLPQDPNSLSGDFITQLWPAENGLLWVGTRHSGLSVFDPKTERFTRFSYNPKEPKHVSDAFISTILGDDIRGQIWLGTLNGLDLIDKVSGKISHFKQPETSSESIGSNRIRSLMFDKHQRLLVGTDQGVFWFDREKMQFSEWLFGSEKTISLQGQSIDHLFQANNGKIYLASKGHGIAIVNLDNSIKWLNQNQGNLSHNVIIDIAQPSDNEIWLATYGGGINIVDAYSDQVIKQLKHDPSTPSSINHNNIGAMHLDDSGLLWIGTWGAGLNRFNPHNQAFRILRHSPNQPLGLSFPDVLSVMEAQNGDIWIGTRGNGVDVFRPDTGRIKSFKPDLEHPNQLKDGSISALHQSQDGTIWVGTRQTGLYRFQTDSEAFTALQHQPEVSLVIKRLMEDKQGNLWVGTGEGIEKYNPKTNQFVAYTLANYPERNMQTTINALAQLNDGTLFFGATDGLYVLQPDASYLKKITHDPKQPFSLSHNTVTGLFVDDEQKLWVATQQGLDRLEKFEGDTYKFEAINKKLGLQGKPLWPNILSDHLGRLWDGQSVIDLKNTQRHMLSKAEGVDIGVNWYSSFAKTQTGTLLYGGSKGLLMVKPQLFNLWDYQPNIVISKLAIDGKSLPSSQLDSLTLPAETKSFTVEFSALDFSEPEKNQYTYQLQGFDSDWKTLDADSRSVTYTNLYPDTYRLRVKGSNRLGLWSNKELQLVVNVLPKWYQTSWFIFTLPLIALMIFFAIYHARVTNLKQVKAQLKDRVKQQTEALKESADSILTLSDIGNEISSTLDLDKILDTVYFHVNRLMDASVFCIGFYEPDKRQVTFKLTMEKGQKLAEFTTSMDEKERLVVWCIENQKPIIINDFLIDKPKYFGDVPPVPPKAGEDTASVIYWPLIVAGRTIGAISVQSFKQNAYTVHHQNIIRTLASTTAIAMDNANAYRKAKHAAKVKSTFLANMSHEIRTPMNGILGMTHLLKKTALDLTQKEYVDNIDVSAKNLLHIINDILDFSKVEAGKMPLEEKPFSLSQLLNSTAAIIETLAHNKGLEFDYTIAPNTPADLIGDITRLNQILLNLCSNAVKFTEKGKVELRIKPLDNYEKFCTLQIKIIDQGIGIPKDSLPKLFQSFSQADTSTTRKYGGSGLGLVISRELARKMHGDITVHSQQGVGTCFTLVVELQKLDLFDKQLRRSMQLPSLSHVLLFDNDETTIDLVAKKLPLINSKLKVVSSLPHAVSYLSEHKNSIDSILLSWDLSQLIRSEFINKAMTICPDFEKKLIVYGQEKPRKIDHSDLAMQIDCFLQKPLSIVALHQVLEKHLAEKQERKPHHESRPLEQVKILLAEDNKINQMIANKILTELGAIVSVVENGEEAIENASNYHFDVILMDIQMPKVDGIKATQQIRQHANGRSIPIIAMTANVLQSDVDFYRQSGLDDHISKPFETKDLIAKISKQLAIARELS